MFIFKNFKEVSAVRINYLNYMRCDKENIFMEYERNKLLREITEEELKDKILNMLNENKIKDVLIISDNGLIISFLLDLMQNITISYTKSD